MGDRLKPSELRDRARQHRQTAEREMDPDRREGWLAVAREYERLAETIEQERKPKSD